MGNSIGGKKTAKIMKVNGETIKLKTPVLAGEVVKDYPGYVLLESQAVKHFGVRATPLELHQKLEPKRLYFLVELPKFVEEKLGPRRVRSGINMSAKDRLESLMLSRRSVSDLSIMKPTSIMVDESKEGSNTGGVKMRMRLPKAEVTKLMQESKDGAEAAQKIMDLCLAKTGSGGGGVGPDGNEGVLLQQQVHWKGGHGRGREGFKAREKRVSFLPVDEGEIQLAVASLDQTF
ncbi:hypothetical protein L1049_006422 [Liquidambar formosana]|uniref:Plastid movement impaired 2 n=1 Tax=Liquidambar formosana TaxID=63359 RepID=A0AAP0RFH4_LIQFO